MANHVSEVYISAVMLSGIMVHNNIVSVLIFENTVYVLIFENTVSLS